MENMVLDAWNDLSYLEGALFTAWLFILYYGKVWIDSRFTKKGMHMLTALIGPIANLAGSWMNSKVEKVKADGQAKVAQARAKAVVAEKVATGEVAWEKSMADATDSSWKDEFALVVLLAPAILVFVPSMTEYVRTGFEVLNTLPDWYQYLLFIAVSSSFGIKGVGQAMKLMGKK